VNGRVVGVEQSNLRPPDSRCRLGLKFVEEITKFTNPMEYLSLQPSPARLHLLDDNRTRNTAYTALRSQDDDRLNANIELQTLALGVRLLTGEVFNAARLLMSQREENERLREENCRLQHENTGLRDEKNATMATTASLVAPVDNKPSLMALFALSR
jgi:hypothetical protein